MSPQRGRRLTRLLGDVMENLAIWLSAFSAFFAAVAAIANLAQARKAAQSTEVDVYLQMSDKYASPEMRNAISTLVDFWKDSKGDVVKYYNNEVASNPQAASGIRGHARYVSHYFVNIARLYEAKLISKHLFRILIYHPGLNIFYQVSVPLNITKNPNNDIATYVSVLKKVANRYGDGRIY